MKNLFVLALLFITGSLVAHDVDPIVKSLNTSESVITWKGKKVTGSHTGTIAISEGGLEFDESGMLSGGSFTIDMNTIECTDLKGKGAQKLVGHLKSDDFFGVNNHPMAKFEISKVVSRGTPGSYKIVGNLTIKEITKEIKFNADLTETSGTAEITIDRTDYNVRYGSGSFFDNLGDKTIYDEFELVVNLAY
ncbi:MAG: YceI family protein [Saprospiraceae bacterium]|nr:YceI family protein [Saprospiraceae bacterium]